MTPAMRSDFWHAKQAGFLEFQGYRDIEDYLRNYSVMKHASLISHLITKQYENKHL
jgi:hypothetical protein